LVASQWSRRHHGIRDHTIDPKQLVQRLLPFDISCVMRERTPLSRTVIQRLPGLKLIASTGSNAELPGAPLMFLIRTFAAEPSLSVVG
jgi:hypothetical protein